MSKKPCARPKEAVAATHAIAHADGYPGWFDAAADYTPAQQSVYERAMAHLEGRKNKKSSLDFFSKSPKKETILSPDFYTPPSEKLAGKFYTTIDKNITAWARGGKRATRETYNQQIATPARKAIKDIDNIMLNAETRAEANLSLKKMGLKVEQVYEAREYLKWLADGGHLKTPERKAMQSLNKVANNVAKAQANLQVPWTLGNIFETQRIFSGAITVKGGGVDKVFKGIGDLMKASGGNPFKQLPELKKANLYYSDNAGWGIGNSDIFEWTVTLNKNLAYHIHKATGGNGVDGVRDWTFDTKPWDRPPNLRDPNWHTIWGLIRYPINETRWYCQTLKKTFAGDKRAAANLAAFAAMRLIINGPTAMMPAIAWACMSKETRDWWKEQEKNMGVNVVARATGGMIDPNEYLQPGGGAPGARLQSIEQTTRAALGNPVKATERLMQGKPAAASANLAASAIALANLTGFDKMGILNSTTLRKMMETTADQLAGEFSREGRFEKELLKDAIGRMAKTPDEESNVVNMARPSRPSPPQRPSRPSPPQRPRAGF